MFDYRGKIPTALHNNSGFATSGGAPINLIGRTTLLRFGFCPAKILIEIATSFTFGELFAMIFRRWIPAFAGMALIGKGMTLIGAVMMLSNNYEH